MSKYLERIPRYIYPKPVKSFLITAEPLQDFPGFLRVFSLPVLSRFRKLLKSFKFQKQLLNNEAVSNFICSRSNFNKKKDIIYETNSRLQLHLKKNCACPACVLVRHKWKEKQCSLRTEKTPAFSRGFPNQEQLNWDCLCKSRTVEISEH